MINTSLTNHRSSEESFSSTTRDFPSSSTTTREFSSSSTRSSTRSSTMDLANSVVTVARSSQKLNTRATSIAQLRVSNMKLHGRDDDLKLLRGKLLELTKNDKIDEEHAAQKSSSSSSSSNLILVSGTCGTGKSALIRKGLGDPATKRGFTFASGKSDEKLLRPLSAFTDAMASIAKSIIAGNKRGGLSGGVSSIATIIRDEIRDEFDEEDVGHLRRALPGWAELLDPSGKEAEVLHRSTSGFHWQESGLSGLHILAGKESISQLHYAIRRLLKIVCSNLKGVVLFLDDLQWSDAATLDLLKSILLDGEIPSLLIVGAYRQDEVPEHFPLAIQIRDLEQMNVPIAQIKLDNLSVENVIPLVAEALGMDDEDNKVISLAETIHKKTDGNPFFVLMFLRSLYDEKLIEYNFGALKWTWDDDAVKSKIVTDNVASVLIHKMHRLQEEAQTMLMVASCLGATFRKSAVLGVTKNMSQVEMRKTMSSVSSSLLTSDLSVSGKSHCGSDSSYAYASAIEELEGEGLFEVGNEECHFVHEQIQSAAFELICPDQRDSFRGRIGRILLKRLSPEELEASLFEVVGLLNCAASEITDKDRDELAMMNLKAGIKASENAAFDVAKVYFEIGREVLGPRGWEGDHQTMLDLCSHGANACFLTGDFDTMNALINEALSKDIDTKEKYNVSDIKVRSLFTAGNANESIDAALDFRRQLGLPISEKKPASKFTIIREFIRVKKLLKNKTAEDIANLPMLDDELYEMGQRMIHLLGACVYQVEPTMFPLIVFQGVATSLRHGLDSTSSESLAMLGMLLCGPFGKPREGLEMAKAAELILEKPGMRRSAPYIIFTTQGFCYHWTSPLQETLPHLLKGYQIALETGEHEKAGFCLIMRSYHLFFTGRSLDSIQEELEVTIKVLTELKQEISKLYIIVLLTTVKKLRGTDVEADDKILESTMATAASTDNIPVLTYINVMKLEEFVMFQQWKEAIDLVRKVAGNVRQNLACTFASVRYTFLEALTYLKAAHSATEWTKRQMKKSAKKMIQLIQGWAKKGNVNVVHYLYILEAELATLDGKHKNNKAKEKFEAAIATSSRHGFLQDRALAHELAGEYFKAQGDDHWGNYQTECSRKCYQEWGGASVKMLSSLSTVVDADVIHG